MEIRNTANQNCEDVTNFHKIAFLELTLFTSEMRKMTDCVQRDTAVPPMLYGTARHNTGVASHPLPCAALSHFNTPSCSPPPAKDPHR